MFRMFASSLKAPFSVPTCADVDMDVESDSECSSPRSDADSESIVSDTPSLSDSGDSAPATPSIDAVPRLPLGMPHDAPLDWNAHMADVVTWLERHLPHAFDLPAEDDASPDGPRLDSAAPAHKQFAAFITTVLGEDEPLDGESLAFYQQIFVDELVVSNSPDFRLNEDDWAVIRESAEGFEGVQDRCS